VTDVAQRAVEHGFIAAGALGPWLRRLRQGPYLAGVTLHTVVAAAAG